MLEVEEFHFHHQIHSISEQSIIRTSAAKVSWQLGWALVLASYKVVGIPLNSMLRIYDSESGCFLQPPHSGYHQSKDSILTKNRICDSVYPDRNHSVSLLDFLHWNKVSDSISDGNKQKRNFSIEPKCPSSSFWLPLNFFWSVNMPLGISHRFPSQALRGSEKIRSFELLGSTPFGISFQKSLKPVKKLNKPNFKIHLSPSFLNFLF